MGGWHSEGIGGPSLQVQYNKQNQSNAVHLGQNLYKLISTELYIMQRKELLCTVAYTQRFEGRTGLNCVGGVNEVQGSTEDTRQNICQLLPRAINAAMKYEISLNISLNFFKIKVVVLLYSC